MSDCCFKLICKKYTNYTQALRELQFEVLETCRKKLLLRMAKKLVEHDKMAHFFEPNNKEHNMITRKHNKYQIFKANTERYKNSSVIRMQSLINEEEKKTIKKRK